MINNNFELEREKKRKRREELRSTENFATSSYRIKSSRKPATGRFVLLEISGLTSVMLGRPSAMTLFEGHRTFPRS